MHKEKKIIALSILLVVSWLAFSHVLNSRDLGMAQSIDNPSGSGISIAMKLLENKAILWKGPFLFPDQLSKLSMIIIDSPMFPASPKEIEVLKAFVVRGGTLHLSFLREEHFYRIDELLRAFGIRQDLQKNSSFKNAHATILNSDTKDSIAVYSNLVFKETCASAPTIDCYSTETKYGLGKVILQAGLPLFANGVLTHEGNKKYLLGIADHYASIAVDGYHQFFSQRSWGDFFMDYRVSLPIVTFILFLFVYMFFDTIDADVQMRSEKPLSRRSYHEFYLQFLSSSLDRAKNRKPTYAYLKSAIESLTREPVSIKEPKRFWTRKSFERSIAKLISFHQELRKKGR